jgi:hypothetical protein
MWEAFHNSIAELAIHRINFEDAADRERHNAVVRLVRDIEKTMLTAQEGLSATERSMPTRRTDALREQLDDIALDLYGITDREERGNILALEAPRS